MENISQLFDITSIATNTTLKDVQQVCEVAKAYNCKSTIVPPCYFSYSLKNTIGADLLHGTICGFPLGSELTASKVYSAKQLEILGAQELDMVMNIGAFLSGNYNYTKQDITAVCEAVKVPVKVIVEAHLLTGDQLVKACELVMSTSAEFIKTSTGLMGAPPTTVDTIKIIKETVGDKLKIKASGGIRDVSTIEEMVNIGVERFGIGVKSALPILAELMPEVELNIPSPTLDY